MDFVCFVVPCVLPCGVDFSIRLYQGARTENLVLGIDAVVDDNIGVRHCSLESAAT